MWRRAHVAAGRPPPLIHDSRLVDQAFMRKVTRLEMFSQMHIRSGQEEEEEVEEEMEEEKRWKNRRRVEKTKRRGARECSKRQ